MVIIQMIDTVFTHGYPSGRPDKLPALYYEKMNINVQLFKALESRSAILAERDNLLDSILPHATRRR